LAILSGDATFLQQGDQMYKWLKSSGIVTADYKVYDGLDEDRGCGINGNQLSYKAGFLVGGLSWMFRASGNQFYMDEAHKITTAAMTTFTQNGIITDQCEPKCSENQVSPKGTMIRGLGHVIEFSNDAAIKAQVKTTLATSVTAMLKTCDATLNCGAYWNVGAPETSNVHYQTNALELMTAYLKTFKNGPTASNIAPPTTPPSSTTVKQSKKGGSAAVEISIAASLLAMLGFLA
jgi:mannan endo-1,6-alpha-mannosidase